MKKYLLTLVTLSALLTGCLKDKNVEDQVYGLQGLEDRNLIELSLTPLTTDNFLAISLNSTNTDTTMNLIPVTFASNKVAEEDIKVILEPAPALIGDYNATHETTIEEAPSTVYQILNPVATGGGYVVTIPKGSRTGYLQIKFKPSNFLGFDYGVAMKISRIENPGYLISKNFATGIVNIVIKNQWDGVYSYKGYSLRAGDATLTGYFSGKEMPLVTSGSTSVTFGKLALWGDGNSQIGIGNPKLFINTSQPAPHPVTISSDGGAYNAPGYTSRYDPATKTFFISFTWGAGPAARLSTDTLTYLRAR